MSRKPLTDGEIIQSLQELNGWERDGDKLVKTLEVSTYPKGLALATAIGMIADGFDHHPDLIIGYKTVRIEFTTHDAGYKITATDFRVAQAVDALKIRE